MPDSPPAAATRSGNALVDAYNQVAYTGLPAGTTHPYHLAAVGMLLGLDVPPVATSRVLELACGDGTNLVPMAAALPRASFTGCDFSARAIAQARRMADGLGVTNCRLLECDLRDLGDDLGGFDYIIAHGLYSWIPAEVRTHVLPVIARHLSPNGVAFVSYNTYPGCRIRQGAWDMLKFHTRDIEDPGARVVAARELIDLLVEPAPAQNSIDEALRVQLRAVAEQTDSALCHDDLGEPNNPFYFHEFAADAGRSGLAFLAESEMFSMVGAGVSPRVREALAKMDRLTREQYLDFVHLRRFRESLLCHAGALSRFVAQPSRIAGMHVAASRVLRNAAASGATTSSDEQTRALREFVLARWPRSVPVAEIIAWYKSRAPDAAALGTAASRAVQDVAQRFVGGDLILRSDPVPVVARPGERPVAFAPARWMLGETDFAPSIYHETVRFAEPGDRKLVALLDGRHTRANLIAALGEPFVGPSGGSRLDAALHALAQLALLEA
jgi:SAM-dependent methyltransferase